ncbi:hypothetical protein QFC21_006272 [Naganishia friedmannii]|uniref:Uncharacterized protein n=1 Tax=Naganishia friedmannii TaxID=89922 RepID=A0ACC2V4J1_9TREE|nr:hypothetical protein QFC21_006272 [Naganishia friedmannii]
MVKHRGRNQSGQSHAVIEISESGHEQVDHEIVITGSSTMRKRLLALARGPTVKQLDPDRPFDPDILQNIGDMLVDSGHWKALVDLSRVSRYFNTALKYSLRHLHKQVVLRLENLNLKKTKRWSQVRQVHVGIPVKNTFSAYPINPSLSAEKKKEQLDLIKNQLKPSVIRFVGQPHESAFQLQSTLFPTVKVIRFLEDPLSSSLDHVFIPGVVEEKALALINRKCSKAVGEGCTSYCSHYYPPATQPLKIVEYQKKGVEYHDLKCLDDNRIQSSIEARTARDEYCIYMEDWEDYGVQQNSRSISQYMRKHIKLPARKDFKSITVDLFLKPDIVTSGTMLMIDEDHHPTGLDDIFDIVHEIATNHLDGVCCGTGFIKFRLYFIHGNVKAPVFHRPDYSEYEMRELESTSVSEANEGGDDEEDRESEGSWGRDSDDDDNDDGDNDSHNGSDGNGNDADDHERKKVQEQHRPVMTLAFHKSRSVVRIREYDLDKDMLGCYMNGGCSRCNAGP